MQDTYLKIFDNLFLNIDENEDVKEIIEQASFVLDMVITKLGEVQNEMIAGTSRQDDFVDTVIIAFVRKIMEQLDAINVLYSHCSFEQAQVILRSMIENVISLEFILKEDTSKRAAAYYLEHHYQELDKSKEYFTAESELEKQTIEYKGQEEYDNVCSKLGKKKQALKRIIEKNFLFQEVDSDRSKKIDDKKKENIKRHQEYRKVYIQWYEVCSNISSFKKMMKEVGYAKI